MIIMFKYHGHSAKLPSSALVCPLGWSEDNDITIDRNPLRSCGAG